MKKMLLLVLISTGFKLKVFYWFLARPNTRGVKCVIFHGDTVLLVRPAYGHKMWMIPGGGVKRKETFVTGARRELKEETGITTKLTYFYEYTQVREFKHDIVQCFYGYTNTDKVQIDNFEIIEYGWFTPKNLPVDCSPSVARILHQYKLTVT